MEWGHERVWYGNRRKGIENTSQNSNGGEWYLSKDGRDFEGLLYHIKGKGLKSTCTLYM